MRAILGALSIASAARDAGFTDIYLPEENAEEAALISGIRVHAVISLKDILEQLEEDTEPRRIPPRKRATTDDDPALDQIRGQESAKRGLVIAAAGGHNIALYGPPGTGKTLLARACRAILPDLSEEEMIEVTTIHSLAGDTGGRHHFPPSLPLPRTTHHRMHLSSAAARVRRARERRPWRTAACCLRTNFPNSTAMSSTRSANRWRTASSRYRGPRARRPSPRISCSSPR